MRARLVFLAAFGLASMAACGGGGGSPQATPSPTPSPIPSPTNDDSRPATTGDTFVYGGSMSVAFVRPPQANGVIPSPNPPNTQTLSYKVAQNQTVATGASYNGVTNAIAFTTAESDTLLGGLATTSTSTTEYYDFVPSGSSVQIHDLGGTSLTSGGDTFSTTYGPNDGIADVLPEVAGAIVQPNDATATRTEQDADGSTSTRTTNADGTYTETDTYIDGTTATATANADGSGMFSLPIGYPDNLIFAVAAPVAAGTSAPTSTIPITLTYPAGFVTTPNASPTPTIVMRTVNTWYPQPLAISTQELVDNGQTSIPAACGIAPSLVRAKSNALASTSITVDTVFGELDTRTSTQYTEPGVGIACVLLQDVLQQYYDFSQQNGQYVETTSIPAETTTTTEALGLASENVIGLSSVARTSLVAASRARFSTMLDRKRAARHAAIARTLRASSSKHTGGR